MYYLVSRSKWPRAQRHELPSLALTLGSWVRIPLGAWMFSVYMRLFCVCVVLCLGRGLATSWSIIRPRSPIVCEKMITELNKRHGSWMGWKSHCKKSYLVTSCDEERILIHSSYRQMKAPDSCNQVWCRQAVVLCVLCTNCKKWMQTESHVHSLASYSKPSTDLSWILYCQWHSFTIVFRILFFLHRFAVIPTA
jgi:hypothetical protein